MMKKIILLAIVILRCTTLFAQYKKVSEKDVQRLYKMMQGNYSSEAQSIADTSYFNILLKMKPMWTEKKGEYWLYVEQAMSTTEDKPYRQRAYQLKRLNDSTITSTVYTIKNGEKYFGDWRKDQPLANLPIDSLEARKGCLIYIHKTSKKHFEGSTNQNDCESNLRGASYATTIVRMRKKSILSWDRGYDKAGKQVWGAVRGGYLFRKL
jgi:CpeT protein